MHNNKQRKSQKNKFMLNTKNKTTRFTFSEPKKYKCSYTIHHECSYDEIEEHEPSDWLSYSISRCDDYNDEFEPEYSEYHVNDKLICDSIFGKLEYWFENSDKASDNILEDAKEAFKECESIGSNWVVGLGDAPNVFCHEWNVGRLKYAIENLKELLTNFYNNFDNELLSSLTFEKFDDWNSIITNAMNECCEYYVKGNARFKIE